MCRGGVSFTGPGRERLAAVTAARKVSTSSSFSEAPVPDSSVHAPTLASPEEAPRAPGLDETPDNQPQNKPEALSSGSKPRIVPAWPNHPRPWGRVTLSWGRGSKMDSHKFGYTSPWIGSSMVIINLRTVQKNRKKRKHMALNSTYIPRNFYFFWIKRI